MFQARHYGLNVLLQLRMTAAVGYDKRQGLKVYPKLLTSILSDEVYNVLLTSVL